MFNTKHFATSSLLAYLIENSSKYRDISDRRGLGTLLVRDHQILHEIFRASLAKVCYQLYILTLRVVMNRSGKSSMNMFRRISLPDIALKILNSVCL